MDSKGEVAFIVFCLGSLSKLIIYWNWRMGWTAFSRGIYNIISLLYPTSSKSFFKLFQDYYTLRFKQWKIGYFGTKEFIKIDY